VAPGSRPPLWRRAHVVGAHHRAEATAVAMAWRPATPTPSPAPWPGDGARRGHEHRKNLARCSAAASPSGSRDRRLRGQRVHALRPADARQQVEADGRGLAAGERAQCLDRACGLKKLRTSARWPPGGLGGVERVDRTTTTASARVLAGPGDGGAASSKAASVKKACEPAPSARSRPPSATRRFAMSGTSATGSHPGASREDGQFHAVCLAARALPRQYGSQRRFGAITGGHGPTLRPSPRAASRRRAPRRRRAGRGSTR